VSARGESVIFDKVRGVDVPILLTNRALMDVENATNQTILKLANAPTEEWGMTVVAHLLRVGMEYGRRDARMGGRPYNLADAFTLIDQHGYATVLEIVVRAFTSVIAYAGEDDGPPV
jgi:hypothetical protein